MTTVSRHRHLARRLRVPIGALMLFAVAAATADSWTSAMQVATPPMKGSPDSLVQPNTPAGEVIKGEFSASAVYPGTWRDTGSTCRNSSIARSRRR